MRRPSARRVGPGQETHPQKIAAATSVDSLRDTADFALEATPGAAGPRRRTEVTILVAYVNRSCAYIRGGEGRQVLTELRNGRVPCWSHRMRAWHCQPHTMKEAIAVLRSRGRCVEVVEEAHMLMTDHLDLDEERAGLADRTALLW